MQVKDFASALRGGRLGALVKIAIKRADDLLAGLRLHLRCSPKPMVLFSVHNSFGFAAQAPVIRQLLARDRVDVVVTTPTLTAGDLAALCNQHNVATAKILPAYRVRHARPSAVVLTEQGSLRLWRTTRWVFLHHGSSFGNLAEPYAFKLLESGVAQYLLCLAREERRLGEQYFGGDFATRAVVVGAPKLDALVIGKFDRAEFLTALGLDPQKTTILVTSHWTPTSLWRSLDMNALRAGLSRADCNVLVTGHALLFEAASELFSGRIDWLARLRGAFNATNMRVIPPPVDNAILLAVADLLISDHSSVTLEFAVLGRPILIYRNPLAPFPTAKLEQLWRETATVFHQPEELSERVSAQLHLPIDPAARARLLDYCFDYLGRSAPRAAQALESLARHGVFPPDVDL